jgi:two-component system, NarL family, nitrate/nitrite response regulator NarL
LTAAVSGASRRIEPSRVVLADDECLFRASLRQLLSVPPAVIRDIYGVDVGSGFHVVGEAGSGEETVRVVRGTKPDLLILDLSMPRLTGTEAMRELQSSGDRVPTVMLAGHFHATDLLTAIQVGINGIVPKHANTELLFEAMIAVLNGGCWVGQTLMQALLGAVRPLIQSMPSMPSAGSVLPWNLTTRERQVLRLVAAGCPNREIAERFAVSEETVKHHMTRLFAKVGASTRLELAMAAQRHDPSTSAF